MSHHNDAACTLERHLVESSAQSDRKAQFAATFLAILEYFSMPAGGLRWPDTHEIKVLSELYEPGTIDLANLRSTCVSCSPNAPCMVARALELCSHVRGEGPSPLTP